MNAILQRKNPTRLELAGYAMLDRLAVRYARQELIKGKFTVDAFVECANLVIQFDGDYWHGNSALFPYPDHRQKKRMALDKSQDAYMRKCGFKILRFWESTMTANPALVERIIRTAVTRHSS